MVVGIINQLQKLFHQLSIIRVLAKNLKKPKICDNFMYGGLATVSLK